MPQFNNLLNNNHNNHYHETKSGLEELNKNALPPESIKYIQDKYLPIVTQYNQQKETRELQINPYLTNSKLEQEIINSIEQIYYSDLVDENDVDETKENRTELNDKLLINDEFDPFEHILDKLPNTMDLGFILEEKKKLNKQLMVVTKRVSDLIQQNQATYNKELESVIQLQEILTDAINICSSGRSKLDLAKKSLTYPNLNIISTYRRREIMISLAKEFFTIKTLLQTELTLNDLIMEDEDYAGAIRLCLECLKIISTLNHYKCVTDLGAKLNYTIQMTEERLDLALARLCINFNLNQFSKAKETFDLLDKTQFLYDQLLIHFSTVINDKTFNIVNSYVELCVINLSIDSTAGSTKERNFEDVCAQLSTDCFLPCLIDFSKSMWHIMINYKKFINAHDSKLIQNEKLSDNEEDDEIDCNLTLIKQKLRYGLTRIWQEIENKLIILIRNHNLSIYSFDDFITMINIVRKLASIGCEFSNAKQSSQLEDALRKATSEYFYVYHKTKMEEIKVFLETELWQLVPMKSNFSILQLHEFNFLKNKQQYLKANEFNSDGDKKHGFFNAIESQVKTPFDKFIKLKDRKNDDDEQNDEIKVSVSQDSHDREDQLLSKKEETGNDNKPVIVTNSSLNILRIVGKYMQIMIILNQISFDVLLCIFHLFNYYLYGVCVFFSGHNEIDRFNQFSTQSSSNLANLIKRIESQLILNKSTSDNRMKFHSPELSSIVNLNDKDHLFGLLERAIGVESL